MDSIAEHVLKERYYQPEESSWRDVAFRVANFVGNGKVEQDEFFDIINDCEFIPNSPCLMNAGTKTPMLFACFVLDVPDDMKGIGNTLTDAMCIQAKGGGCISGDSLIITENGPICIRDFVESDINDCRVLSYDENTHKVSWKLVEQKHITPTDAGRVYDIKCSNNYKISASDWHPFFVFDGNGIKEKRADELEPRDLIIGSGKLLQEDIKFNADAWVAGFLISDGAFDTNNGGTTLRLRVVKSYESVIKRAAEIIGCKYGLSKDQRYEVDCYAFELYGKDAEPYFKFYGDSIRSLTSTTKFIPSHVYTRDASYQFSLLVGMLDGDGWYNKEKKQYVYDSASKDVVYGLHMICGILGIPSRIRVRKPKKDEWSDMYSLIIENSHIINEYISEYSSRYSTVLGHKSHGIYLDHKYFDELNKKYGLQKTIYWRHGFQLPSGVNVNIQSWKLNGILPKSVAAAVLTELGYRDLAACINSGYQVKNVTRRMTGDTLYDLTVRDSHTYFAGTSGFAVVHNTGFYFGNLRPKGALVKSTNGIASGPVSFLKAYDAMTNVILQGGRRRGANMGSLSIWHPDIREFITCKHKEGEISNFNISVLINDKFMNNPDPEVFDLIAEGMWKNGEPGLQFFNNINANNPTPKMGDLYGSNPCSETFLYPNESCVLGSIDVSKFVIDGVINYGHLKKVIELGVTFLDNCIEVNEYPTEKIQDATKLTRKIGLGIMGYADLLIKMGIRYGSKECIEFTNDFMVWFDNQAIVASKKLAEVRGNFPAYDGSIWDRDNIPMRNAVVTLIAPTGSISLFAGCSSGIEPNFAYVVNRSTWSSGEKVTFKQVNPLFDDHVGHYYPEQYDVIINWMFEHGTIQNCSLVNKKTKDLFVSAKDISWKEHVDMLSTFQKYIHNSISKTVNLPSDTPVEEMKDIIKHAWSSGCKGLTVYREGSRNDVVLETNASKQEMVKIVEVTNPVKYKLLTGNGRILPKTPKENPAAMYKRSSGCGHMMIAIGEMESKPHSVTIVNKGGCDALTQALAELTALALRWNIPLWDVKKVLTGIKCSAAMKNPKSDGKSCPDILGRILSDFYPCDDAPPKEDVSKAPVASIQSKIVCPSCGNGLIFAEGCVSCNSCGYTKCSG